MRYCFLCRPYMEWDKVVEWGLKIWKGKSPVIGKMTWGKGGCCASNLDSKKRENSWRSRENRRKYLESCWMGSKSQDYYKREPQTPPSLHRLTQSFGLYVVYSSNPSQFVDTPFYNVCNLTLGLRTSELDSFMISFQSLIVKQHSKTGEPGSQLHFYPKKNTSRISLAFDSTSK